MFEKKKKTLGILEFNRFITDSILSSWTSVADILLKKMLAVVYCIVSHSVFCSGVWKFLIPEMETEPKAELKQFS